MLTLDPAKHLSETVPKTAQKLLSEAVSLLDEQLSGLDSAVHQARKRLKRVRALLKLVESSDHDRLKAIRTDLSKAARGLSDLRDAAALVECTEALEAYLETRQASELAAPLHNAVKRRQDLMAIEDTSTLPAITGAMEACRQASDAIGAARFSRHAGDAEVLAAGRRKNHDKARSLMARCHHGGDPDVFHDLRKCAQTTFFQAALLHEAWPFAFEAEAADAKKITDLLGHEHDISVLNILMQFEPHLFGAIIEKDRLAGLLNDRRSDLRHEAMVLADRLYHDSGRNEADRLGTLWRLAAKKAK
jgi:CHAD domain-containing protein